MAVIAKTADIIWDLLESGHLGFLRFFNVNLISNILFAHQMEQFNGGQNDGPPQGGPGECRDRR